MIPSRPIIFISAVSTELRSTRDLVAKTLLAMGYEPKWQDIASTETGDLRAVLRKWVDQSHAVLQIVGHRYGRAPKEKDPTFGPVSYTQYEALYAHTKHKKVWYIILDEHHPTDPADPEPEDLKNLQVAYRIQVKAHQGLYHSSDTALSTENIVLRLRDELARLRRKGKQLASIILLLLGLAIGGIAWNVIRQEKAAGELAELKEQNQALLAVVRELPAALAAAQQASPEADKAAQLDRAYASLDESYRLPPGTLKKELPAFARQLLAAPDTLLIDRANAEFVLENYSDAEKLALQAKDAALAAAGQPVLDAIAALQLAGQSAAEQIQYQRALDHYRAAAALTSKESDILTWVDIQNDIGELLILDGKYQDADTQMQEVVEVGRASKEAEDPVIIHSQHLWAMALDNNGKYAEAEREHRAVVAIRERVLGAEDIDTLRSRNNLASTLMSMGRCGEAEEEYRAVQAIFERDLGPEATDTLNIRNNVALAMDYQGKDSEAEKEFRAVLSARMRTLGPEHLETLYSRNNLAMNLNSSGNHVEAEREHTAVLEVLRRKLGPEHPVTLSSQSNVAATLVSQSKYASAEQEHRAIAAIRKRTLGVEHPATLESRSRIAKVLHLQGKYVEAEREFREVLAIQEKVLGPDHVDTLRSCHGLAMTLAIQGKSYESIELGLRAFKGIMDMTEEGNQPSKQAKLFYDWMQKQKPTSE